MLGSNPGLLQLVHWQSDALTTRLDLMLNLSRKKMDSFILMDANIDLLKLDTNASANYLNVYVYRRAICSVYIKRRVSKIMHVHL